MHFKTKNTPAVNRHVQRSKKFQTTRYHLTRFSSINVRTAGKQSTLAQHVITIKELGHDIACLQETRIPGQGGVVFEEEALKGWKVFHNGVKTAKHGVGIVTAPHVDIKDVAHHLDGRIMSLRVVIHGIKVTVVCCYGPTEEYAVSTKEAFYNTLQKTISSLKAQNLSYKLFLGGDFNASIGHDAVPANWACLGNNNDDCKTSTNGRKLIELCEANELRLTNTMFDTKTDQHRWSFKSNLGYYRRLDYVAVDGFLRRYVKNSRVYPTRSEAFESDHRAVVATLYLPSRSKRRQTFKSREKSPIKNFDCRFLRDDELTREKYAQKLDEYLESCNRDEDFVDNIETMITSAIQSASAETIPVVQADRLAKPWQNEEYLNLIQARKNEKDEQRRRELGKLIKNMRFKLENEYFKAKADEINLASEARSTEEEFRLAKSFTSLNRVDKPLVSKQALEDHFAKHFSQREVEKPPEIINPEAFEHILPPADLPTVDESAPDEAEIQRITSKFKNGKCQGTDKIKSEQLKYSTSAQLLLYLGILMSTIWSTMKIPANWLAATITCLHKKGSKSLAENYRGISIMSSCSKLLSMTCVERIRERYEQLLLPTQYGFRANRSTTDAIYILRHVLEKTTTPLFICFIDLRAAYDWIPRELLFEVLLIRLKSPKIVELLKLLYTGTKACIKGTKTYFDTWVGCRQGALESPTIFNIYLDFVVRVAREEVLKKLPNAGALIEYIIPTVVAPRRLRKGPLRGENRILELLYADDEVVFGNSLEELIQILEIYDKTFTRFGLTMAYKKTETMPFNVPPDMLEIDSLLQINNVPIKNVRTFKYLGQGVTNDSKTPSKFLHLRIAAAFAKWSELKHILTNQNIYLGIRMKFLTACVRSRLLYGVQAWELSAKEIQKIEVVWNGFLRKMVRGGFKRKNAPANKKAAKNDVVYDYAFVLSNENIKRITKSHNISDFCHVQFLKYTAHVCRMDNDALQKQVLFDLRTSQKTWKRIENLLGVDREQALRVMMVKKDFMALLDRRFPEVIRPKQHRPRSNRSMSGKK